MKILRDVRLPRTEPLRALPGDPAARGSRCARGLAARHAWERSFRTPCSRRCPGCSEHGCSYGEPGGFLRRMQEDEGTWLGHVVEHVAHRDPERGRGGRDLREDARGRRDGAHDGPTVRRRLRVRAGGRRTRGRRPGARPWSTRSCPGRCDPRTPMPRDFDFAEERDAFIRFAQRRALGPSTASLVRAAEERDIPWLRLNRYSLVQFGHGKYQQRIQATVTSETRHIAVEIASDKEETNRILADLGLPVPRQTTGLRREAGGACRAAHRLPGRRQAAQRQPRPRRLDRPRRTRSRCASPSTGARAQPHGHRRELHRRASTTACWS